MDIGDLAQGYALPFFLSTGTGGISDAFYGYEKYKNAQDQGAGFWEAMASGVDRAIDPGGFVDEATRYIGEAILPASVRGYAQPVAAGIGSYFGPMGAAIGSGIGSKLGGQGYAEGFGKAGMSALLAYLSGSLLGGGESGGEASPGYESAASQGPGSVGNSTGYQPIVGDATLQTSPQIAQTVNFSTDSIGQVLADSGQATQGSAYQIVPGAEPIRSDATLTTEQPYKPINIKTGQPWYSNDNISKGLKWGSKIAKLLNMSDQPASGAPPQFSGNTVDIEQEIAKYRQLMGEAGVSKSAKAKLFSDFEIPKANSNLDLLLGALQNYKGGQDERQYAKFW